MNIDTEKYEKSIPLVLVNKLVDALYDVEQSKQFVNEFFDRDGINPKTASVVGVLKISEAVVNKVNEKFGTYFDWPEDAQDETNGKIIVRKYIQYLANKIRNRKKYQPSISDLTTKWKQTHIDNKSVHSKNFQKFVNSVVDNLPVTYSECLKKIE